MKIRKLKELLGGTEYIIADFGEYMGVGSPYVHDIFCLYKDDLRITKGRYDNSSIGTNDELDRILTKLESLVESGEIQDILDGDDEIEDGITVYSVKRGDLVVSTTDEFGWPNVTHDGVLMYENTHFLTAREAIERGMANAVAGVSLCADGLAMAINGVQERIDILKEERDKLRKLYEHLSEAVGKDEDSMECCGTCKHREFVRVGYECTKEGAEKFGSPTMRDNYCEMWDSFR